MNNEAIHYADKTVGNHSCHKQKVEHNATKKRCRWHGETLVR